MVDIARTHIVLEFPDPARMQSRSRRVPLRSSECMTLVLGVALLVCFALLAPTPEVSEG